MIIWKRKVGDMVVLGDEAAVVIASVNPSNGGVFKGTVSLGFEVPDNMLVQRAETYQEQGKPLPFPQFFRVANKETDRIFGYSFEPASEGSTLSYGYKHELVAGYDDMTEDDHTLVIYLFRSEAEAEACILGVTATDTIGVNVGVVKHKHGRIWAVLFDFYQADPEDVNPVIRSFVNPNPKVEEAIQNSMRRKAG